MYDPISVSTALVSSGGDLLIELTDGTIINAGRVRGNPGPQGEKGEQGIRGAHGKDGIDGTHGAKWHTGVGAPELSVGENGDMYMDVASALLPIFQKVNGDWLFLTNLKVPPSGGGGGQSGAAGGGGSIIIYPPPNSGDKPTVDNDGKPVDNGDLWYDPTTGHLWVYHNNQWTPIGDRPPVIVQPNPPNFNSSSEDGSVIKYPLAEGDLWFDSDQAALYVAAKDNSDNLVWVITTPADRSILQDEVPVNFSEIFPAGANGGYAMDGDTHFNVLTGIWYKYNAPKNQWIDLPPGVTELSLQSILLETTGDDLTFEYNQADRDNYGTDALCYINDPDFEPTVRLVIPKIDTAGFDWTVLLRAVQKGDHVFLVQAIPDELDVDGNVITPGFTHRVDYQIDADGDITENADSFSFVVNFFDQDTDHAPMFGELVGIRILAQIEAQAVCIDYGEDKPEPKCIGHLWFDSSEDEGTLYIFNGTHFIPAAPPVSLESINSVIGDALAVQEQIIARVEDGEVAQATLQTTVADALTTQQDILDEQIVQNNQIIELEEEIESLAPSLDRGKWTLHEAMPLSAGQYAIGVAVDTGYCIDQYERCLRDVPGYPDNMDPAAQAECNRLAAECETAKENGELLIADWAHAAFLHFHKTDSAGKDHTFSDYAVGKYIDLFNEDDSGFGVFEITTLPVQDGDMYTIGVTPIQHKEEASGLARLKLFSIAEGGDITNFVRKTGDEMSGALDMQFNPIENAGRFEHEHVEEITSNTKRAEDYYMYQRDGKGEAYLGLSGSVWLSNLNATQLDIDGNQIPWDKVEVGDYIKVSENSDSTRRYSIFGPVTEVSEYELEGVQFFGCVFENHHAIINGPLVIRINQQITISRVEVSGKESNVITDFGGEIHGRLVLRHPGASPIEIHADDLGDNFGGSGIQIFGNQGKKLVEISSGDGRLKCYNLYGEYARASSYSDVVTRGYLIQDYGKYNHIPSGFDFDLKYMETATDSQAMEHARHYGQWAKTNNGIWINHLDKHRLVDLSPFYTSNQGTFTNPDNVEEDIEGEVSTFSDELVLDYQGLYGQRGFLSVFQEYNRDKLGLRRVYAISKVTYYKNEPFIKLEWTKNSQPARHHLT